MSWLRLFRNMVKQASSAHPISPRVLREKLNVYGKLDKFAAGLLMLHEPAGHELLSAAVNAAD